MSKHNYSQYSNKKRGNGSGVDTNVSETNPKVVMNTSSYTGDDAKLETTKPKSVLPAEATRTVEKPVMPELVQETVSTVTLPDTIEGTVINCAKLNVRENATVDSGIVCVLDVMSEIQVDVNKSSDKWVYVYTTTGAEGYCMRQYVDVCL